MFTISILWVSFVYWNEKVEYLSGSDANRGEVSGSGRAQLQANTAVSGLSTECRVKRK